MRRNKQKEVGYTTGVGKTFAISYYINNKKSKAEQTAYLINIMSCFFRIKDWVLLNLSLNIFKFCFAPVDRKCY